MKNLTYELVAAGYLRHLDEVDDDFAYVVKDDNITDKDIEEVLLDIIAQYNIADFDTFRSVINNNFATFTIGSYSRTIDLRDAFKKIVKSNKGYTTYYKFRTDCFKYFETLKDIVKKRCLNLKTIPQMEMML